MNKQVPKNWEEHILDNIANINYGTRIVKDTAVGNKYYVYGGGDKTFLTNEYNRENTLVVARFGMSPKCTRFIEGKFFLNDSGLTVETKNENVLNQKFLNWQIYFLNDYIYSLGKGVAQKNLNVQLFKKSKIFVPASIIEQQEIVQVLDTMSDIIRLREECISHAQALIPALFQEMFDNPQTNRKNWQICRMKDISEIDRQNISPEELKNKRYTYIGLEHIEKETGRILIDPNNQNDVDLKSNKFLFTNRHVLYGKLRPYLNKVALPNFEGVCSTDIFPLLPKDGISNRFFLKTLMSTPYFVNIANSQSSGANLPRIGTAALENIKVFKPDYMLQEQFAQKAIEIESYIKEQDEELKNAKQMFQSLLHHAFTGKLTAKKYGGN